MTEAVGSKRKQLPKKLDPSSKKKKRTFWDELMEDNELFRDYLEQMVKEIMAELKEEEERGL